MTIEDIRHTLEHIRAVANDPGEAHCWEDILQTTFIKFVADSGPPELAVLAKEVLKTSNIEFPRWYS